MTAVCPSFDQHLSTSIAMRLVCTCCVQCYAHRKPTPSVSCSIGLGKAQTRRTCNAVEEKCVHKIPESTALHVMKFCALVQLAQLQQQQLVASQSCA